MFIFYVESDKCFSGEGKCVRGFMRSSSEVARPDVCVCLCTYVARCVFLGVPVSWLDIQNCVCVVVCLPLQ